MTHAIPVYEGFALQHAVVRMDLAGRDVTNQLQLLLRRNGHRFVTSAEMEIVRQIKETSCFVSSNAQKEENKSARSYELPDGSRIEVSFLLLFFLFDLT